VFGSDSLDIDLEIAHDALDDVAAQPVVGDRDASASASPSLGPGTGILRAETGGGFQAQNAGERPEFCSQTALRLANRPKLREFLWIRKPRRFAETDSNQRYGLPYCLARSQRSPVQPKSHLET